jgi:hypothetical protein
MYALTKQKHAHIFIYACACLYACMYAYVTMFYYMLVCFLIQTYAVPYLFKDFLIRFLH